MADVRVGLVLLVLSVVHLPLSQSRAHHLQMHLNTKDISMRRPLPLSWPRDELLPLLLTQRRRAAESPHDWTSRAQEAGLLLTVLQQLQTSETDGSSLAGDVSRGKRQRACYWNVVTCF
ncbi:uncharacterized protein LOC112557244 [Pomacea canaliculata]|uniref:uncharacterized protein LOC112557244 n=1 Tax=Pomacea canaliculata TaxID=400727 RepID=UPI000D738632|nr:uncharacterized protein LOC112557244 [Pomacea canaliculata]